MRSVGGGSRRIELPPTPLLGLLKDETSKRGWRVRRLECVRERLRPIFYGCVGDPGGVPRFGQTNVKGATPREWDWAEVIGRLLRKRVYRYSELLRDAEVRVRAAGYRPPLSLKEDATLLVWWAKRLAVRATAENRWANAKLWREADYAKEVSLRAAETAMVRGVCPLCAGTLPCDGCRVPAVEYRKGEKHGVVAVAGSVYPLSRSFDRYARVGWRGAKTLA